ncbi:MAG TPA: LuxR C-terminal-related transcriptional regulator [Chloroflexia bacterium]
MLATKLYIPPSPPTAVQRARLLERLTAGLHRKLTLIAAPAGFGKTTLVSAWVAGCGRPVVWLSLDAADSDPARFLTYLVTALRGVAPDIGEGVLRVLAAPQPPPPEAILTSLLNEIAAVPQAFVLVLDDYHLIEVPAVDQALAFLIEHLPPQMHLVIATREDPPLPLARLRARAQLTEVRGADLRFTSAEAAAFLRAMGLNIAAEDVTALEERTEGWIAGLQLAALSLRGHEDVHDFIQAFAGDHRYILDYLVEEVLQRQPAPIRRFLLQTAILDRLYGPLCEAVTGQPDGSALLEDLERGNFFVVPLDDRRQWYRYHHLFGQVLSAHLRAEQPDQVATLHRRASAWYEQQGAVVEAIHHALAAADFARAADLIERTVPEMRRTREVARLLSWFKALPDAVLRARPVLSAEYGGVLLADGQVAGVEARLQDAERWLDPTTAMRARQDAPAAMVVVDDEAFRRLPGAIAMYRAGLALVRGDVAGTMHYARQARDLAPEDDDLGRSGAVALLGLASWASGDLAAAHRTYAEGMAGVLRAGFISDAINGAIARAEIRIAQGRLHEAGRTYEQALQLAAAQGEPVLQGTADLYVGLSELARERNDLPAAAEHLQRSQELGERTGFPQNRSRWCVAMARIRQAQGDLAGALDLLQEAERRYVSDFFPNVRPVAAWRTRVWVAQRRLGDAFDWARERGLSVEDDLSYLREFEHLTLARVLLARYTSDGTAHWVQQALGLLARLLQTAEAGERTGSVIEILVLQALAHQAQGAIPAALVPLQRALALAEPEGYVRIFVDEGAPMAVLLQAAARQGIAPDYSRQLLAALGPAPAGPPAKQPLIEPLSDRELEVLRLLGSDLSGPEIARALMVSLNTMNTHTKNIYAKLGANNRRAAVRRAAELHLL